MQICLFTSEIPLFSLNIFYVFVVDENSLKRIAADIELAPPSPKNKI